MGEGRWYTSKLWVTTEPVAKPMTWWRRITDAWQGTSPSEARAPEVGVHEYDAKRGFRKRTVAHIHDRALREGFESEMQEAHDRKLGHWWVVTIRRPGDKTPEFVDDRP